MEMKINEPNIFFFFKFSPPENLKFWQNYTKVGPVNFQYRECIQIMQVA